MKRKEQIQKTCAEWHGGQWSALYQFCSSGVYLVENHLRYLKELQECREPEYYLHPGTISKADDKRLQSAQKYFTEQGKKIGVVTDWKRHKLYGYEIPFIFDAPETIYSNIISLRIPI
jgi:hypothetical protein